jgi:hypothetical protein
MGGGFRNTAAEFTKDTEIEQKIRTREEILAEEGQQLRAGEVEIKGKKMALTACDWCGAYAECEKCDDPTTAKLMDELDDPMDADQGGHTHACCDEHELYWKHADYWNEREGEEPEICTGCHYGKPDCICNKEKR